MNKPRQLLAPSIRLWNPRARQASSVVDDGEGRSGSGNTISKFSRDGVQRSKVRSFERKQLTRSFAQVSRQHVKPDSMSVKEWMVSSENGTSLS
jgi:hypothetical protein